MYIHYHIACFVLSFVSVIIVSYKLFKLIKDGDRTAIMFYLKTKGGWTEKQYENKNYDPVSINIIAPEGDNAFFKFGEGMITKE